MRKLLKDKIHNVLMNTYLFDVPDASFSATKHFAKLPKQIIDRVISYRVFLCSVDEVT